MLLSGCASTQFRNDLSRYQDRVWDRTQSEFLIILEYLLQHHSMAREQLSGADVEVLAVDSSYHARGFSIITFEKTIGNGYVFCSDGTGYDAKALQYGADDLIREGINRQREFNEKRQLDLLKKKYDEEEYNINHPKKLKLEEIIGITNTVDVSNRLKEIGRWPWQESENRWAYYSFYEKPYKDGTISGLKSINPFKISSIVTDYNTGNLRSVGMSYYCPTDKLGEFCNAFIHTLQSILRTPNKPDIRKLGVKWRWTWSNYMTDDGRSLDIELNHDNPNVIPMYDRDRVIVGLNITDKTECYNNRDKNADNRYKQSEKKRRRQEDVRGHVYNLDKEMYSMFEKVKKSLVLVSADKGQGSGFIAMDQGKTYLFTNEHVVRGSKTKPHAVNIDGEEIRIGAFEFSRDRDLVRFEVAGRRGWLALAENLVSLNEPVLVFGNSDGSGVITALRGNVIGLGPSLLEITAEFIQGNSGSPVLTKNGTVLGVATFAINSVSDKDWLKKGSPFDKPRRFAIRLDNVQWTKIDWNTYSDITK